MASIVGIALLSIFFASSIHNATIQRRATIKAIKNDAAPSIVAGQEMLATLADMHSDLANELLIGRNNVKDDKYDKEIQRCGEHGIR